MAAAALPSTTASKSDLNRRVTDITRCPICLEDCVNPKSLPCLHSFCLQCLQDLCEEQAPRDVASCPVCRKEFEIPERGLDDLPHNFFLQNLIEAKRASSETRELLVSYCDLHAHKRLELFCFKCNVNICRKCCVEDHMEHRCKEIDQAARELVSKMDFDVQKISERVGSFQSKLKQTDDEDARFVARVREKVALVKERGEYMKNIIDSQVFKLIAELENDEVVNQNAVADRKDVLECGLVAMESFNAYSLELKTSGSPCDITRAANDLHMRAEDLLQTYDIPCEDYCAPDVEFVPAVDHDELDGPNLIGHVVTSTSRAMKEVQTLPGSDRVLGVTMLNQEVFVLRLRHENQVSVYSAPRTSAGEHTLLRQFTVHGFAVGLHKENKESDMTSSVRTNHLYLSDFRSKCIHRLSRRGNVQAKWPLSYKPFGLSMTRSDNLLVACFDSHKLIELDTNTGDCVLKIPLQADIQYPLRAVKLFTRQCVVSHGGWGSALDRVCVVDASGKISLSYGDRPGQNTTQLNYPRYVTTDDDEFIFVADGHNARIAVFSPRLQLIRHVQLGEIDPRRLCYDTATRRLYVGYSSGNVTVMQM